MTLLCDHTPDLLDSEQIFGKLKGQFISLLNNDQICGAMVANAIGELSKSLCPGLDEPGNLFSIYFEEIFKLMLDFANFAFKEILPSDAKKGNKILSLTFSGLYNLLQYAPRNLGRVHSEALASIYDCIT